MQKQTQSVKQRSINRNIKKIGGMGKHKVKWQLMDSLREIVFNSSENTTRTLWSKIKRELDENEDLFKVCDQEAIYKESLDELRYSKIAFNFLKSGYFKGEGEEGSYMISEIVSLNSYTDGERSFKMKNGSIIQITQNDYNVLKLIFK